MTSKQFNTPWIDRRKLLKTLVTLPLFSLSSLRQSTFAQTSASLRSPRSILHVYCHGLHAYVFNPDHILLLAPYITEHKYLAGAWLKERELKRGESYSLIGVSDPDLPNPRPAINKNNLLLSGIRPEDIRIDKSYCQVKLPYPSQFISLRYTKASFEGKSISVGSDASAPAEFPLLQVLQYEVHSPSILRLDRFAEWVPDGARENPQQLHLFAEPQTIVPNDHATRAFDALVEMFSGVDLKLKPNPAPVMCPASDPNDALGLVLEQEKSLAERESGCGGEMISRVQPNKKSRRRGAQPANCFSVIVNPS